MKISDRTLTILKNFSRINQSISVDPGNILTTVTWPNKSLFAKAVVAEEFDTPFAIYDLNEFLALTNTIDDPDFTFSKLKVRIVGSDADKRRTANYTYADRSMLPDKPTSIRDITPVYQVDMTKKDIQSLIEASNILQSDDILFQNDGSGNVVAIAKNTASSTSHEFILPLGSSDANINVKVKKDNFKVIPDDYKFSFTDKPFLKMESADVTYWLAGSV